MSGISELPGKYTYLCCLFYYFCSFLSLFSCRNSKTVEITGFSKEEAMNKPFVSTFVVSSLRTSVQDILDNALQGQETSNYQLEFRTKSNEIRYLLVNATTRRDAENNIVGVVGVAQDVTEAAQQEKAVSAMANELVRIIDLFLQFGLNIYA